jgi:hypothetical protein
MKDWQPIASAPFDREIQVSVIEKGGVHALIVPCRPMQNGCTCLNPRAIIIDRPMVRGLRTELRFLFQEEVRELDFLFSQLFTNRRPIDRYQRGARCQSSA